MTRTRLIGCFALALLILGSAWLLRVSEVSAVPPAPEPAPTAPPTSSPKTPADGSAPSAAQGSTGNPSEAPVAAEPQQDPTTATIIIATVPAATATVTWGRKLLGRIKPGKALVVKRPLDSGPLDIMVRAVGYLPVQTRAHTFSDNRVIVKLTRPENAMELWGYRAPTPDAGVLTPEEAAAQNAMAPPLPGAPLSVVPGAAPAAPVPGSVAPVPGSTAPAPGAAPAPPAPPPPAPATPPQ